MENKKIFGFLALGISIFMGIGLIAAHQGDYSVQGPNYSEDRHEAMEEIFDNVDYDAWVSLMTENGRHQRVVDVVTEDNFATFVEAREAAMAGDSDRALELRSELGLNNGSGHGKGSRQRNSLSLE